MSMKIDIEEDKVKDKVKDPGQDPTSFQDWIEMQISSDREMKALWFALKEVITDEMKENKKILASALYPVLLRTIVKFLDNLSNLEKEIPQNKKKGKKNNDDKIKKDAYEIDFDNLIEDVQMHIKDDRNQINLLQNKLSASFKLLQHTSYKLSDAVIWNTISFITPILSRTFVECKNHTILSPALTVIANFLLKVPSTFNENKDNVKILYNILIQSVITGKPKVRKRALRSVKNTLENLNKSSSTYELFMKLTSNLIDSGFKNISLNDNNVVLYTMELIKTIINFVPLQNKKAWLSLCLSLLPLGASILTQCSYGVFKSFFESISSDDEALHKSVQKLTIMLINSIFESQPSPLNKETFKSFSESICAAFSAVKKLDDQKKILEKILLKAFECFVPALNEGDEQVALDSMKFIIFKIEDSFIDLDIKSIELSPNFNTAKKTILYQILNLLSQGLQIDYHQKLDSVLIAIGYFYERLGNTTIVPRFFVNLEACKDRYKYFSIMSGDVIKKIVQIRLRSANVEKCLKYVLLSIGIANFVEIIPISFPDASSGNSEGENLWLLTFFRENLSHSELSFFYNMIPAANILKQKSEELLALNQPLVAKHLMTLHNQIWSIFPKFCTSTRDISNSFGTVAESLGQAILQNKTIRIDVVNGLNLLITKSKQKLEKLATQQQINDAPHTFNEEQIDYFEQEQKMAQQDIETITAFAPNYLPVLFNVFIEDSTAEDQNCIFKCIESFVNISSPNLVNQFFQDVVSNLLTSTSNKDIEASKISQQIELIQRLTFLAVAFVPFLDQKNTQLLFKTILPNLQLDNSKTKLIDFKVQKKSWKVLEALCEFHKEFVEKNLSELQALLSHAELIGKHKISILKFIGDALTQDHLLSWLQGADNSFLKYLPKPEIKKSVLTPLPTIILALRENSTKTRQAATSTMQHLTTLIGVEKMITFLIVGLSSSNPNFKAATITSFKLVLETFQDQFSKPENAKTISSMIKATTLLLDWQASEVKTASLDFLRAALKYSPLHIFETSLKDIINSIMHWPNEVKTKYMKEMRRLTEKFIKKFGYDHVLTLFPKSQTKFLHNVNYRYLQNKNSHKNLKAKKLSKKALYNKKSLEESQSDSSSYKSDSDYEVNPKISKKSKNHDTWVVEGENPIDFNDPSVIKKIVSINPNISQKQSKPIKNPFSLSEDGKILIDDLEKPQQQKIVSQPIVDFEQKKSRKRKSKNDSDSDIDQDDEDSGTKKKVWYDSKGFKERMKIRKKVKVVDTKKLKDVFKAKNAGGDTKKSGQADPYAYIKNNPAFLNKRNRSKSVQQYEGLVRKSSKKSKK